MGHWGIGAYISHVPPLQARELIAEYRGLAAAVRTREGEMAGGLQIFSIDPPDNKETASTEKELELLEQVWLGYPNPNPHPSPNPNPNPHPNPSPNPNPTLTLTR